MNKQLKKKKIFIAMVYDIVYYPPVISLCNVLIDLNYDVIYMGECSNINVASSLNRNGVKLYIQKYGGNGFTRFIQQYFFRRKVKKILIQEYENNSLLWLVNGQTMYLFSSFYKKYKIISYLLEYGNKINKAFRFLSPFFSYGKCLSLSYRVICCEYNRAQITKAVFNLTDCPFILPNKAYFNSFDDEGKIPIEIENVISNYRNKKIILYQGIFNSERKLDYYMEAINKLPDEYVLFLMGKNSTTYSELKKTYESERIVFLPFIPPPLHMKITELAYIGILSYIPLANNFDQSINVLYCAPNKIYEYSKFGVPMIANDLPALQFAFLSYRAGICVEKLRPESIINAIIEIDHNYSVYSHNSINLYNSVDLITIISDILAN